MYTRESIRNLSLFAKKKTFFTNLAVFSIKPFSSVIAVIAVIAVTTEPLKRIYPFEMVWVVDKSSIDYSRVLGF